MTRARDVARRQLWVPHRRIDIIPANALGILEISGIPTDARLVRIAGQVRGTVSDTAFHLQLGVPGTWLTSANYTHAYLFGNGSGVNPSADSASSVGATSFLPALAGRNDLAQTMDMLIVRRGNGSGWNRFHSVASAFSGSLSRETQVVRSGHHSDGTAASDNWTGVRLFFASGNFGNAHLTVEYSTEGVAS